MRPAITEKPNTLGKIESRLDQILIPGTQGELSSFKKRIADAEQPDKVKAVLTSLSKTGQEMEDLARSSAFDPSKAAEMGQNFNLSKGGRDHTAKFDETRGNIADSLAASRTLLGTLRSNDLPSLKAIAQTSCQILEDQGRGLTGLISGAEGGDHAQTLPAANIDLNKAKAKTTSLAEKVNEANSRQTSDLGAAAGNSEKDSEKKPSLFQKISKIFTKIVNFFNSALKNLERRIISALNGGEEVEDEDSKDDPDSPKKNPLENKKAIAPFKAFNDMIRGFFSDKKTPETVWSKGSVDDSKSSPSTTESAEVASHDLDSARAAVKAALKANGSQSAEGVEGVNKSLPKQAPSTEMTI